MPKKKSMSIGDVLVEVKKGVYKEAVLKARAAYEEKAERNKTDLVCFVGNPSTVSYANINNNKNQY